MRYRMQLLSRSAFAFSCLLCASLPASEAAALSLGGRQYEKAGDVWVQVDADGTQFEVDPRVITVRFRSGFTASGQSALHATLGTEVLRTSRLGYVDLGLPDGADVIDVVSQYLRAEGDVISAEPNTIGEFLVLPFDGRFGDQWHLDQSNDADIDAPEVWDLETGSAQVIVGILDSGTDWSHDDLGPGGQNYQNIFRHSGEDAWSNPNDPDSGNGQDDDNNGFVDDWKGWDFGNGNNDARSPADHGTRVAGVTGAKTSNGFGVAGVAGGFLSEGAQLMTLGVGESGPLGSILDDAIIYATDNGARVITMSLTVGTSGAIDAAVAYAYDAGVFIDCASGNSSGPVSYPARLAEIVAVGATDESDRLAGFSSRGEDQEVAAPGVGILSTVFNDGYGAASGTSFSAPIVAGVAALMFSANPALTNLEVRQILQDTSEKVGNYDYNWDPSRPGHSRELGYGRVNARDAVEMAGGSTSISDPLGAMDGPLSELRNHPNPFSGMTEIQYALIESGTVKVSVHTPLGQLVTTIVDAEVEPGLHSARWNGRDDEGNLVPSGVYFYQVIANDVAYSRKLLLAR